MILNIINMLILTIIFIVYEFIKLANYRVFWKFSQNRKKYPFWRLFELMYLMYLLLLFFTKYWLVGLTMIIVSIVTAFQTGDKIYDKSEITKPMRNQLIIDGIVSMIILSTIVYQELI
jgi:hypothetical protein